RRGRNTARGRAATARAGYGISAVPDEQLDVVERNAERVSGDDHDDGAAAGAEVLSGHLDFDRPIGMNGEIAIAVGSAASPSVQRESESSLDRPRGFIAARMPNLFPVH